MKVLCETTGPFQLVDFTAGAALLPADRPGVMEMTNFLSSRAGAGQVRVIATVNDEATDEEWAKYLKESEDLNLAQAAFEASFAPEPVEKPTKRGAKK